MVSNYTTECMINTEYFSSTHVLVVSVVSVDGTYLTLQVGRYGESFYSHVIESLEMQVLRNTNRIWNWVRRKANFIPVDFSFNYVLIKISTQFMLAILWEHLISILIRWARREAETKTLKLILLYLPEYAEISCRDLLWWRD